MNNKVIITTIVIVPIAKYYIWTSTRTDNTTPWYSHFGDFGVEITVEILITFKTIELRNFIQLYVIVDECLQYVGAIGTTAIK